MTSERNHWKQTNFSVKILAPIFRQKQLTGAQCYSQMWSCRLQFASFHQTCCLIKDLLHLSRSPICSLSACGFETSFKKKKNHHYYLLIFLKEIHPSHVLIWSHNLLAFLSKRNSMAKSCCVVSEVFCDRKTHISVSVFSVLLEFVHK